MATTYLNNSSNTVTPDADGFTPDEQLAHHFDGTEDRTRVGTIGAPADYLTAGVETPRWSGGPFNSGAIVVDSGAS